MRKGLIILFIVVLAVLVSGGSVLAQVYKIVDENGNVTYTDEPPGAGAEPMDLPQISVIETDYPDVSAEETSEGAGDEEGEELVSLQDLRNDYRDFRILEPRPEQTYNGTANTVVISWGSDSAYMSDMRVSVIVDSNVYDSDPSGNLPITLDRGEHQVYAILLDGQGRQIITTDAVTFHVRQQSRLNNPG